jgi:hypothetical protein
MPASNALSGSLRDLPVADLLALLANTGQTGIVELRGAVPGFVALDHGWLTLAAAGENLSLEQMFVGSGITSSERFQQAHQSSRRGVPLVEALLRQGARTERLEAVLREQIVGALFEFVLPSDTYFVFLPDLVHPIGNRFRFHPGELVTEAARRIAAWRMIADAIPSTAMVMALAQEAPDDIVAITADDWRVLARVDGRRTIAELIRSLGMSAFAVCAVLHRLLVSGIVVPVEGAPIPPGMNHDRGPYR